MIPATPVIFSLLFYGKQLKSPTKCRTIKIEKNSVLVVHLGL